MAIKLGIIITASLSLVIAQRSNSKLSCTNLGELAEPCGCPLSKESFDPICGTDGRSYLNACFLECKQTIDDSDVTMSHKGPCSKDSPCTCNAIYNPVCGSNGITYPNECVLKCNIRTKPTLKLKSRGRCVDESHERSRALRSLCHCNPSDEPLCASNGVTYINFCVLKCKANRDPAIKFKHMGPCEDKTLLKGQVQSDCVCNSLMYARCGGHHAPTTPNPCELECQARDPRPRTPCDMEKLSAKEVKVEETSKSCICAAVNRPVCGTNRETYANMCVLHCNTKRDASIKFQAWGSCENVRLISRKTKPAPNLAEDETLRNSRTRTNNRYAGKGTYLRVHYV